VSKKKELRKGSKAKLIGRLAGAAVKLGTIAVCPPLGILIGANEAVNLVRWHKKRKGQWNEEDENKALVLKMMCANPTAATELIGKAAFKGNPPEFYRILSKTLGVGMALRGDISSVAEGADAAKKK